MDRKRTTVYFHRLADQTPKGERNGFNQFGYRKKKPRHNKY